MKADRLLSIITLLQRNKLITAKTLAKELEVSIRTIYRDIEALSSMGIPVYSDRGINGGIKLLGDYKTSLTGITTNELPSLFLSAGDKILTDLGYTKLKNSSLLKFASNSSLEQITEINNIQNFIYIDMNTWQNIDTSTLKEALKILQDAIWTSKAINIKYQKQSIEKIYDINPLGLVCKKGTWYLVGINSDIIKTYKISSIIDINKYNHSFTRPENFNLENYWTESTKKFMSNIPKILFQFKIDKNILNIIKQRKPNKIKDLTIINDEYFINIEFNDIWEGVEFSFSFGTQLKILKPQSAIDMIKSKALEVISLY